MSGKIELTANGKTLAQFREEHGIVSTVLAGILCAMVTSRQVAVAGRELGSAAWAYLKARGGCG